MHGSSASSVLTRAIGYEPSWAPRRSFCPVEASGPSMPSSFGSPRVET
ncbi:MAG TPA: hypothetical protein VH969_07205 [Actinophytocola sp.]